MSARTYEFLYPSTGNITVALIKEIKEMGAYVFLSEYGDAQGMLMMSELSRRRIRSVNKLIKVEKVEVVVVIRVDKKKGYIDLSKRRIAEGENFCMEKKWIFSRMVNSICNQISKIQSLDNEDCRIRWNWPIYRKFGHAIRGFKQVLIKNRNPFKNLDILSKEFNKILEIVKKKLPSNFPKVYSDFELNFFSSKGISILKNLFKIAIEGKSQTKIEIRSIAPPLYHILINCDSKKKGIKIIIKFFKIISEIIKNKKMHLIIKNLVAF